MRGARRLVLGTLGAVAVLVVLVGAAWALDTSRADGKVLRNVSVGGRDVGGMNRTEVVRVVADLARRYKVTPIEVEAPGGGFSAAPEELGLVVDEEATVQAVLDEGRDGGTLARAWGWAVGFVDPRDAPVAVEVDQAAVYQAVAERDRTRTPPTEPSFKVDDGRLVAVAGKPGRGIDPAGVLAALPEAARKGTPFVVGVARGPVAPRFDLAQARQAAEVGEAATETPLEVTVDGKPATVTPAQLREWLRAEPTDTGLQVVVDAEEATVELAELLPDVGTPPVETSFTVVDGVPQIVPGQLGAACCAPEAGLKVAEAVHARLAGSAPPGALPLPTKPVEPELTVEEATAYGINEQVSTFTTSHAANQSRVANIHRMADLVRGQVIKPGGTFSINNFVGERTAEKGFVLGGVIEDGVFTESIGGGISQFATTTFNAAFFAGLEFPEYQSHSIYISRYPYGREATLSWPKPDLRIRNPTPYAMLIWPTYTGRSITVTMYSTRWADVTQSNQTTEPRGPCTLVRTERTRRILSDNTITVDRVNALYRPEEGVKCTG
ncbi:MAG: VanW family protein [Acidimicrobiales bacterium]